MNHGFVKVAAAIPSLKVADCDYNEKQIESLIAQAEGKGVEIICFPELCITGYTCGDLFCNQTLLDNSEIALFKLLDFTRSLNIIAIIGMPVQTDSSLINAAVVLQGGKILGIVPKTHLPNHKEFKEQRWFVSATDLHDTSIHICAQTANIGDNLLFNTSQTTFGVEIGEDLWSPIPPSSTLAVNGAELIFNLSANNELIGKHEYQCSLLAQQSARCVAGYIYASCGYGESTQDTVFAGNAMIYENGTQIASGKRFSLDEQLIISEIDVQKIKSERRTNTTFNACKHLAKTTGIVTTQCQPVVINDNAVLTRTINPHPFIPSETEMSKRCEEIFEIQVAGLAKRVTHTGAKTLVIGISGGLDSTLALLVCAKTIDKLKRNRKEIVGITMPGFGTTDRTYNNALSLMQSLGITIREISIKDACLQHFKDINHNVNVHDVTYENSQARERTQVLMDVANQLNGLVIGTGDLSELALGWATYNGDHMSNYGVNASIPKTLVQYLVRWVAETSVDPQSAATLLDIVDTPISPELIPADEQGNIKQKTEDLVGPYELHDFFLYHFVRNGFSPSKIFYLAQIAFGSNNTTEQYDDETIKKWLTTFCRRFFNQQFKRSCLPDGPKVGSVSLSPRGDWNMPSDASSNLWLTECESL